MKEQLQTVIAVLNEVDTHGRKSLNNLLVAIQILENLVKETGNE